MTKFTLKLILITDVSGRLEYPRKMNEYIADQKFSLLLVWFAVNFIETRRSLHITIFKIDRLITTTLL